MGDKNRHYLKKIIKLNPHVNLPSVIPLHSLLHLANYVKLNGNKHVAVFPFPFGTHVVPLLNLVLKLSQAAPNCSFSFIGTEKSNAVRFLKPHIPTNIKPYCISDGIPEGHPLANHPIEKLSFSLKMGSGNLHKGIQMAEEETKVKVTCVIAVAFVTSSLLMAKNLNGPWIAFWPPMSCK